MIIGILKSDKNRTLSCDRACLRLEPEIRRNDSLKTVTKILIDFQKVKLDEIYTKRNFLLRPKIMSYCRQNFSLIEPESSYKLDELSPTIFLVDSYTLT